MIDGSQQLSLADCRENIVGDTSCILKTELPIPAVFQGDTSYTHSQILTELDSSVWTNLML